VRGDLTVLERIRLEVDELAELSEHFESRPPAAVVEWAVDMFHPRLCIAASMTDAVLIDLAVSVRPDIEVVFIDTGYHFPETLRTVDTVQRRYGCDVRIMKQTPAPDPPAWWCDPVTCCSAMKVALLDEALADKDAWMSGIRRDESHTRATTPIIGLDSRGLVKINPLATWSDLDVEGYIADHDVPVNPLVRQGYTSIGCWPCTKPVSEDDHPRAGRWAGQDKTECGLHD
jgi:phosphoadenosine phosphosulfate reductase